MSDDTRGGMSDDDTRGEQPTWGGTARDWMIPDERDRAPAPRPRHPRSAARRAAIRRRRLVALLVVLAIVVAVVVLVLRGCGGDPFVGTWQKSPSSGLIIVKASDDRYTVTNLRGKAHSAAVRTGDTLKTKRVSGGKKVVITLTPGSQAGTLEEHFPDGTTDVLTRQ